MLRNAVRVIRDGMTSTIRVLRMTEGGNVQGWARELGEGKQDRQEWEQRIMV